MGKMALEKSIMEMINDPEGFFINIIKIKSKMF